MPMLIAVGSDYGADAGTGADGADDTAGYAAADGHAEAVVYVLPVVAALTLQPLPSHMSPSGYFCSELLSAERN